jgi:hypothetical protein
MILCPECTSGDIEFFPTFNDPEPADVHCRCVSCGHEWDTVEPSWDVDYDEHWEDEQ